MNEDSVRVLKANLRYLGNTFFYLGVGFFIVAVIVELAAYESRGIAQTAILSAGFTASIIITPLFVGMWLSIAIVGRRIKLLEKFEEAKKLKAQQQMK